uniref:Uncharacterized protein n=1 Tax=Caenorhabditis tropicalis TaxID=1561998 RepID=A0A1I7UBA0_9PELO
MRGERPKQQQAGPAVSSHGEGQNRADGSEKRLIHLSNTAPSSRSSGGGLKRDPSRGYYDVRNSHLMM